MPPDAQNAGEKREDKEEPLAGIEEDRGDRQHAAGGNGADRDHAGKVGDDNPRGERDGKGDRQQGGEDSGRSGDPLPAVEVEPRGEIVSEHGGHAGDDVEPLIGVLVRPVGKVLQREEREKALEEVTGKGEGTPAFAEDAPGVGRANIAAAMLAQVDAVDPPRDVAKRDRAKEEEREGGQHVRHNEPRTFHRCGLQSTVYRHDKSNQRFPQKYFSSPQEI